MPKIDTRRATDGPGSRIRSTKERDRPGGLSYEHFTTREGRKSGGQRRGGLVSGSKAIGYEGENIFDVGVNELQDSIERAMRLTLLLVCAVGGCAAEVCPGPAGNGTGEVWRSWSGKVGKNYCVGNEARGAGAVEWPAAGIAGAEARDGVRVQVCCFESEAAKDAKLRIGDREMTVATHQEGDESRGKDDDFPDLIEEDAHSKSVSIQGTLWDGERAVRVDLLLKCSASKFADRYAFQFTVINRSADFVEVEWDHLRRMRAEIAPSAQAVAGGTAYVFLTAKQPHEAVATIEVKTKAGKAVGTFHFDGYFW